MELKDLIIERAMEKIANSMEKEAAAIPILRAGIKTIGQAAKYGMDDAAKALAKYRNLESKIVSEGVSAIPKGVNPHLYAKQLQRLHQAANKRMRYLNDVVDIMGKDKIPAKFKNSQAHWKLFTKRTNDGVVPIGMSNWADIPASEIPLRMKYNY